MKLNTLSTKGLNRTLLVLLLGWYCHASWSQDQADTAASPDAKTTEAPDKAEVADEPAPDPLNENSPFDYQASEEISQDRSVSFPVDI